MSWRVRLIIRTEGYNQKISPLSDLYKLPSRGVRVAPRLGLIVTNLGLFASQNVLKTRLKSPQIVPVRASLTDFRDKYDNTSCYKQNTSTSHSYQPVVCLNSLTQDYISLFV